MSDHGLTGTESERMARLRAQPPGMLERTLNQRMQRLMFLMNTRAPEILLDRETQLVKEARIVLEGRNQ